MRKTFFSALAMAASSMQPFAAYTQDSRTVHEPSIPPECVALFAVTNNQAEDDTRRIQRAINSCPSGKSVRLSKSVETAVFTSAPLNIKSGVTLWIDAGVTLQASTDPRAYDRGHHTCGKNDLKGNGCLPFISADNTQHSGIMGDGVIDGRGGNIMEGKSETWWQLARRAQKENTRQNVPRLIEADRARDLTLYRITMRNSPNFHVTLRGVDGFTAWGIRIDSPKDARNTDGIDPISSRNITIANSFIRTGDDNIAIKAGRAGPTENISVLRNHFYNGHGMSIGSETEGGVRNVLIEDLSMDGATSGLRIKSDVSRGGLVKNIRYRRICLKNVRAPIDFDTRYDPKATGNKIPVYEGIMLQSIHSLTPGKIIIRGYDEAHPIVATLDGVLVDGDPTMQIANADLQIGPAPVVPLPDGESVNTRGSPSSSAVFDCENRFAPFPDSR